MKNNLLFSLIIIIMVGTTACGRMQSSPTSDINFVPVIKAEPTPTTMVKQQKNTAVPSSGQPITLKAIDNKKTVMGSNAVNQANQASLQKPTSGNYVNAIMYFGYQTGLLYQIYCAPLHITDIEFQVGEKIISASGGDTSRWSISETTSGNDNQQEAHLLVKPRAPDINNVVVVTTNKRAYHLLLKSSDNTYMPIVAWHYPDDGLFINHQLSSSNADEKANNLSQLDKLDFNYTVKLAAGSYLPDWTPSLVFNDGQKTYIRFPNSATNAPTLFIGSGDSDRVVNYRVAGDYYIVDTVIRQGELRMGQLKKQIVVTISYNGNA